MPAAASVSPLGLFCTVIDCTLFDILIRLMLITLLLMLLNTEYVISAAG